MKCKTDMEKWEGKHHFLTAEVSISMFKWRKELYTWPHVPKQNTYCWIWLTQNNCSSDKLVILEPRGLRFQSMAIKTVKTRRSSKGIIWERKKKKLHCVLDPQLEWCQPRAFPWPPGDVYESHILGGEDGTILRKGKTKLREKGRKRWVRHYNSCITCHLYGYHRKEEKLMVSKLTEIKGWWWRKGDAISTSSTFGSNNGKEKRVWLSMCGWIFLELFGSHTLKKHWLENALWSEDPIFGEWWEFVLQS